MVDIDMKAQLAEKLKIVFGKSKKGGDWEYRVSHENLLAYSEGYELYLSYKVQDAEWRSDHPNDKDSGFKTMMDVLARQLDQSDYFFTMKTKMWLLSLSKDERKDIGAVLELLNNDVFWSNLFNWRRMEKLSTPQSSSSSSASS